MEQILLAYIPGIDPTAFTDRVGFNKPPFTLSSDSYHKGFSYVDALGFPIGETGEIPKASYGCKGRIRFFTGNAAKIKYLDFCIWLGKLPLPSESDMAFPPYITEIPARRYTPQPVSTYTNE
jgi:hypothetical protein